MEPQSLEYKVSNCWAKGASQGAADSQTTYTLDFMEEKKPQLGGLVCICLLSSSATRQEAERPAYWLVLNMTLVVYWHVSYANTTQREQQQ